MERLRLGFKTKILAAGILGAGAVGGVAILERAFDHTNYQPQDIAESFATNLGPNRNNIFVADLVDVNPPLILFLSGTIFAAGAYALSNPQKK